MLKLKNGGRILKYIPHENPVGQHCSKIMTLAEAKEYINNLDKKSNSTYTPKLHVNQKDLPENAVGIVEYGSPCGYNTLYYFNVLTLNNENYLIKE